MRGGVAVVPVVLAGRAADGAARHRPLKARGELPTGLPVYLTALRRNHATALFQNHVASIA